MAKRKHYVYVVTANKKVCNNLQSAIEIAMDDMYRAEKMRIDGMNSFMQLSPQLSAQLSAPIITKIWGGYLVIAVGHNGKVRKRRIDVFEPYKQPQGCKQYKVDRAYAMCYER